MEKLTPGQRIRVIEGEYKGREGNVLNPREVFGMFENGAFPIKLDNLENPIAFVPASVILVPQSRFIKVGQLNY